MNCPICQKVVLTHNDYGLCLACADAVINEIDQQAVVRAIKVVRSNTCVQADVATHCGCGLSLLPDGTCPHHFQYTTQRR